MNAPLPGLVTGIHVLADFHGVSAELLSDPALIESLLHDAALAAGATPIFAKFHHFGEGMGITGVMLLRESHISIHTWPESGFAAIDIFMCGDAQPQRAVALLQRELKPTIAHMKEVVRGEIA